MKRFLATAALVLLTAAAGCKDGGGGETDAASDDAAPPDSADTLDASDAPDAPDSQDLVIPDAPNIAVLTWEAPTTNEDGSPLTDLAGYRVYYGTTPGSYAEMEDAGMPFCEDRGAVRECTWVVENLDPGAWYFAVTAYDASGNESVFSNEASKTIE